MSPEAKDALSVAAQAVAYHSREMVGLLQSMVAPTIRSLREQAVLIALGSLAKERLTQSSDIDLCVVHNDALDRRQANDIRSLLGNQLRAHGRRADLYGIMSVSDFEQHLIPNNYFLLCSEFWYSRPIVGNETLHAHLLEKLEQRENDLRNLTTYTVYTLLYREQQCKQFRDDPMAIKYAPGGMRDLQFLEWVARRMCRSRSNDPAEFLHALSGAGFLTDDEACRMTASFRVATAFAWEIGRTGEVGLDESTRGVSERCCGEVPIQALLWRTYERNRRQILYVRRKVHKKVLSRLRDEMGPLWWGELRRALLPELDASERARLALAGSDDAVRIASVWHSHDPVLLRRVYQAEPSWAMKAVLAQNEYCEPDILQELGCLDGDVNADVRLFVARNPRCSVETLVDMYQRSDAYSGERDAVRQALLKRGGGHGASALSRS